MGSPLALLLLSLGSARAAPPPQAHIPFEKYALDNGLQVVLAEDHSIPFVQVNVMYNVGSMDEVPGKSGFAHLFEHLMFQGSAHMNDDYFQPLERIGAQINGTTNTDRTNFFEGVPSEQLPLALWLESDRMGWLLPALDQTKMDNQKDVVRNERRQNYEIRPYGEVWVWLDAAVYPEGHPYHIPTIGRHQDIEAATLDDVKAFFRTWYVPNNATLTLCGDFDPTEAKALVQKYFADIPAGGKPTPAIAAPVVLSSDNVIRKTDQVPLSKVWIAWPSPPMFAAGDADLDILSSVLTDGKDSRLYKALVHDQQIAKDIRAYEASARLGSIYIIEASAAEGHTTDEIVAAVDRLLAPLREAGPTADEVDVAKVNWEAQFYGGLENIASKANILATYNTFTGDPGYIQKDLERYLAVTPDSVKAAAQTWLLPDHRVVLHVSPGPKDAAEEGK